jgi:L-gulonate 3-dehydrogenase
MPDKIASIGRGLVGRAWTIAFARAGYEVSLVGREGVAAEEAWTAIETNLQDLEAVGAIDSATEVRSRITGTNNLAEALDGAVLAMENYPENRDIKHDLFAEMDRHAGPDCILCSSASGISTSEFTEDLKGRHRCLVTHPCNPPSFLRVVEISPAPWTAPEVVDRCREIMEGIGKSTVIVKKEVMGFILNRLHIALVVEGLRLVDQGYVSGEDLEKVVKDGVGPRWAFMGPFETLDLNAPNGWREVMGYFGDLMKRMYPDREWGDGAVEQIDQYRRGNLPSDRLDDRRAWRDRQLMALDMLKQQADAEWEK